jgi:hypothetical protein
MTSTATFTGPASTPTPRPPLDHFQCYQMPRRPFAVQRVSLTDVFGSSTVDVIRPKRLCNPADKNDEDSQAPNDPGHLTGYSIRQTTPGSTHVNVQVTNQFGTVTVELASADMLLVPAAKSLTSPPPPLADPIDHFKCYRVFTGRQRVAGLTIDDEFGTLTEKLTRPVRVCLAADKNGEGVPDPTSALTCYKVYQTSAPFFRGKSPIYVNDQFFSGTTSVNLLRELCVPSQLTIPGVPTPTATLTPTPTPTCTTHSSGTFTDSCDGTVTDSATGLQWEQKDGAGGGANATDFQDMDNRYAWAGCCNGNCNPSIPQSLPNLCQPNADAATTCAAHAEGGTLGCSMCASGTCNVDSFNAGVITTVWDWLNQVNAANFAGHNDWRLPSEEGENSAGQPRELESIQLVPLDPFAQDPCGGPCIDPIFSPTAASYYWSSTTLVAGSPQWAWVVDFNSGGLPVLGLKGAGKPVRAVRGGS